jgi:hypothetical protein
LQGVNSAYRCIGEVPGYPDEGHETKRKI